MKNLLKISFLFVFILAINSCSTDDKVIDNVFGGVTNGAILRTINVPEDNPPLTIGAAGSTYSIQIEEQDVEEGALLQSVDVYVRFIDKSILSAASITGAGVDLSFPADGSDLLLRTIPAAEFTDPSPFGLPRATIDITEADLAPIFNLADFNSFDQVAVRLALNLTDGRVFSLDNATGIVTGGFFNSPFLYLIDIDSGININYLDESRGSFVTVAGFSNDYFIQAELTDQSMGTNISELNVYKRFVDNSLDNGDNSVAEALVSNFTGADFGVSPDGFPTIDINLTEAETLGTLTAADISIDDAFYIRFEVLTNDGRVITNEIVETNFYDEILVTDCPFPQLNETTSFTGSYLVEQITQSIFGYDTFDPDGGGVLLTLYSEVLDASQFSAGVEIAANHRSFDAEYLAPLGGGVVRSYVIQFTLCKVTIIEDSGPIGDFTGWTCGNGLAINTGPADGGTYNATDDSEFILKFTDDWLDDCASGGTVQPQLRFIKQ